VRPNIYWMVTTLQRFIRACTICVALNIALASPSPLNAESSFVPTWWQSIPTNDPSPSTSSGLVIGDVLQPSGNAVTLLAELNGNPVLLADPDSTGFGRIVPLPIRGNRLRLAKGPSGMLWIGGIQDYAYTLRGYESKAYLAKLDGQGRLVWQRTFGERREKSIQNLTALPSGGVVVVGRDNERSWIARVSEGGEIVWEQYVGVGGAAAVASVGDTVAVVAFETDDQDVNRSYGEHVALWLFDSGGNILEHRVVRETVNRVRQAFYGKLQLLSFNNSIYLLSAWWDPKAPQPWSVIKLTADGRPIWQADLPATMVRLNQFITYFCYPGMTVLASGGALIACSTNDQITIYDLSLAGKATQTFLPLPECQRGAAPSLFLVPDKADLFWIFGSRPEVNVRGPSCTWFGQIDLAKFKMP
jgi:hypothetical protein